MDRGGHAVSEKEVLITTITTKHKPSAVSTDRPPLFSDPVPRTPQFRYNLWASTQQAATTI